MPELPEVHTVAEGLRELVLDKKIIKTEFDWPRSFPNDSTQVDNFLVGHHIKKIERRGKAIIMNLSSGYSLLVHLRMTGQLVFDGEERFAAGHPNDSFINSLPDKSTRVIFDFEDGSRLYFNDQRKFGFVKLMSPDQLREDSFLVRLGPEPLAKNFDSEVLSKALKKRPNTSIKAALLDQSVIAGLGNIYVDEALWCAKIRPDRKPSSVTKAETAKLAGCIQKVLRLSIEKGGSTDRNYVDAKGQKGSYLSFANVFRRQGEECSRCGAIIKKIKLAGRGTHFCEVCQQ